MPVQLKVEPLFQSLIIIVLMWQIPGMAYADGKVIQYKDQVNSIEKAARFSGFLTDHKGQLIHIQLTVEKPFWEESSCGFMLPIRKSHLNPDGSYTGGEQYCIEDFSGGYDPEKHRGEYTLNIQGEAVHFEGEFLSLGDLHDTHQGVHSMGLRPAWILEDDDNRFDLH